MSQEEEANRRRASIKAEARQRDTTAESSTSETAEDGKVTEDKEGGGEEGSGGIPGKEGGGEGGIGGIPGVANAEELAAKLESAGDDGEDDGNLGWSHPQSKRLSGRQRSDASENSVKDILGSNSSMRRLFSALGKSENKIHTEAPPMPTIPGSFVGNSGGMALVPPGKSKEELAQVDNFNKDGLDLSKGPPKTKNKRE